MNAPLDTLPSIAGLPFRCESQEDLLGLPDPAWQIHGVVPEGGLVLVFGPSGCGKSFLVTDLAYHLALRRSRWFGQDIDAHQRVLYVAAEAGAGVIKRVRAFRRHYDVRPDQDCPLHFIRHPVDLLDNRTAGDLVTCWTVLGNPQVLVIDTWSRCMVGNENASEDVCQAIATLDRFRQETGSTVIVVHHSPLSDKERPRGHGALFAAADTAISVDHLGEQRIAKLTYQRDGEAGLRFAFRLVSVDVGEDDKGRPITSCIVEQADVPIAESRGAKLTESEDVYLRLLQEGMPDGLALEEWNAKARDLDLCKGRKQGLYRLRDSLKAKKRIHEYADRWYVTTI